MNHGLSGTRIYRIWSAMKRRCDSPNMPYYKWYGGKGVIGESIKRLRKEKDLTQLQLSVLSGIGISSISLIENGRMDLAINAYTSILKTLAR